MNAANYKTTIIETTPDTSVAIVLALPEHRPEDARLAVVLIETGIVYHVHNADQIENARKSAVSLAATNAAWNRCSTAQHGAPKAWKKAKRNGPCVSLRSELAAQFA